METPKPSNLPMWLGVGAIAFSALAAGLAAGPYLRGAPAEPAPAVQPASGATPDSGGMQLPAGEGAEAPSGEGGGGEAVIPLSEDEQLGGLLADMIAGYGDLKRRIEALEAGQGGAGATPEANGTTRLDPATGQEYRAVTVWVPEGMEDEAAAFLREAVLRRLAGFDEQQFARDVRRRLAASTPDDTIDADAGRLLVRGFGPLVVQFAAAWRGREAAQVRTLQNLLLAPAISYARAIARYNARREAGAAAVTSLTTAPPDGTDEREAYDRMRAGIRSEWKTFVDDLPFDVKEQYLSWCSPFLKGD